MILLTTNHGDLLIVLGDDNIERIKQQDPVEIVWRECFQGAKFAPQANIIGVTYLNDDDHVELQKLMVARQMREAFAFATRGFQFRPERGDHDMGPTSLILPKSKVH